MKIVLAAVQLFVLWLTSQPQQPAPSSSAAAKKKKPATSQAFPLSGASQALLEKRPPWVRESGELLAISSDRQYAAQLQLDGVRAAFASGADVEAELEKLSGWKSLAVFERAAQLPKGWPGAASDASGRFWAIGVPAVSARVERPPEIAALWSRPEI